MNNLNKENLYPSKSLYISAYLMASDEVELIRIDYTDPYNAILLFSPYKRAIELAEDFDNYKELPVKVVFRHYHTIRKLVKSHSQPDKGGFFR